MRMVTREIIDYSRKHPFYFRGYWDKENGFCEMQCMSQSVFR